MIHVPLHENLRNLVLVMTPESAGDLALGSRRDPRKREKRLHGSTV